MIWEKLDSIVKNQDILIRVIFIDGTITEWSKWFVVSTQNYGELDTYGPFSFDDAQYIEINPFVLVKPGRLLPTKEVDNSEALEYELEKAGITFEKDQKIYTITL